MPADETAHDHEHGHDHAAESVDGLSHSFHVNVPKSELVEKLEARIEEIRPQVRLKGFRPGKVPASHIRKMFGRSIMDEIVEETVGAASQKALEERKLRPASQPHIHLECDAEAVAKGESDLDFHMHVEVMPEFEPADPKSISLKRPVAEVTEHDVEKTLEELVDAQVTYEPKGEAAKAELKDGLLVDFVGRIDGEEFPGGKAEDAEIVLGAGRLIPGFEDQLIGAAAGDERKVEVTFPDDYGAADLRGKDAVFDVTVKQVRQPVRPTVDDAFASGLGLSDLETLKDALKKDLEREFADQSRHRAKRRLLDALDEKHAFDLPKGMVEAEFNAIWSRVKQDMERGMLDEEDRGKSETELEADYRKIAERRVRLGLVLAEIGRMNDVMVSEEELARAINQQARNFPGQETQVARYYAENAQAREQLRAPIYEEKVVDYLLELAEVEDEPVSREELFTDD